MPRVRYIDPELLEDCPICLEVKAIMKMEPCGHSACDKCIDSWMMNRTSFAQTLRTGSSVTSCPLCRADVQDTVALGPPTDMDDLDDELMDHAELQALAKRRQQEVIQAAREQRSLSGSSASQAAADAANNAWASSKPPKTQAVPGIHGLPPPAAPINGASRVTAATTSAASSRQGGAPSGNHAPRDLQAAFFGVPSAGREEPLLVELEGAPEARPPVGATSRDPERMSERVSNSGSDAGGPSAVRAMEARLAAMMDDDLDIGDDEGLPPPGGASEGGKKEAAQPTPESNDGWAPVGKKGKKGQDGPSDAEMKKKKEEAEEARKHAEWMKAQMDNKGKKKGGGQAGEPVPGSVSPSPPASQASDASTTLGSSPPSEGLSAAPGGPTSSSDGWNALGPPSRGVPADIAAAFGSGFGGLPPGFGGLSAGASSFTPQVTAPRDSYSRAPGGQPTPPGLPPPSVSPTPNGANGATSPAAPVATRATPPAAGAAIDRVNELRTELGSLREQLQAKEAQCTALGEAASRVVAAEARVTVVERDLDARDRELKTLQRELTNCQASLQQAQRKKHGDEESHRTLQVCTLHPTPCTLHPPLARLVSPL